MGYLTNFIVYTLAMVGVIVLALIVFKTANGTSKKGCSKILKIHDTLSLGPRKTLYIVSAGDEKFLIAGDVDKTCLISKLGESVQEQNQSHAKENNFKETMQNIAPKNSYIDKKSIGIYKTQNMPTPSIMKSLAEKLK